MRKREQKKRNLLPVFGLAGLGLVGVVGGTFAYFTSNTSFKNLFSTAEYKVSAVETFRSPDNWSPGVGSTTPKTIKVRNDGKVEAAVRVCFTDQWYEANGTTEFNGDSTVDPVIPRPETHYDGNDPQFDTNLTETVHVKLANISAWTQGTHTTEFSNNGKNYPADSNCYYYNSVLTESGTPGAEAPSPIESVSLMKLVSTATAADNDEAKCHKSTESGDGSTGYELTMNDSSANGATIVCVAGAGRKFQLKATVETVQAHNGNPVAEWGYAPAAVNS